MSELSPRARAACAALRDDCASDDERERVRARLSALGVAMTVTASAALASSAAASSVAGTTSASAGVSSSVLGYGSGSAVSGAALASKTSALALTGVGGKLLGLPVAVKASLALFALTSALAAPKLWPAPTATPTTGAEHRRDSVRPKLKVAREQPVHVLPAPAPAPARADASMLPVPMREPNGQRARSGAPFVAHARSGAEGAATRKAAASVSGREAAQESTLSAESALLESALHALRNGRRSRAQELLLRHEETYGAHALLARERERMRKELSHSPR